METTVKQRLVQFIRYMHLTQKEFESRCGMSNGYVANIRKGIGNDYLLSIAQQFPQLNRDWLVYGEGEMLRTGAQVVHNNILGNNNYNYNAGTLAKPQQEPTNCCEVTYPVVPTEVLRAPDVNIAEWLEENIDRCKKIDLHKLIGNISHVQPMTSRAMEPRIPEGALLFMREVNSWDEALLDGSVYGVDVNKPHMIVRKVYDEGEFIRCEPINPEYGAVRVPKSKVMNLYKIRVGLKVFE